MLSFLSFENKKGSKLKKTLKKKKKRGYVSNHDDAC